MWTWIAAALFVAQMDAAAQVGGAAQVSDAARVDAAAHVDDAADVDTAAQAKLFRARTGIALRCAVACPDWMAEAIRDFDAALTALPAPLRQTEGLTLVLHRWAMPFAMGNGTPRHPDWSKDGTEFHVYTVAPSTEHRASWRLSVLTPDQHRSLWRRRALVHALIKRADEHHGFSKTKRWQRLSGWDNSINVYEGAYSRLRGQSSPQLDLLTFAEEHFVPVEALEANALHADDTIACQELSKSRVLHELLFERGLSGTPYMRRSCPAFEGWADLPHLESIEVLLVSSSGRRPESLFGHLLLRPTHRQGARVRGPTFQSAVQIAAITDGAQAGPAYLARGSFGGYRTAIFTLSMRDLEREVLEDEQRIIRRFRVELSAKEREQVMERIWDLERRGYYAYKFFTDNCATTLVNLLQGALAEEAELKMPGALLAAPSSALDALGGCCSKGQ